LKGEDVHGDHGLGS